MGCQGCHKQKGDPFKMASEKKPYDSRCQKCAKRNPTVRKREAPPASGLNRLCDLCAKKYGVKDLPKTEEKKA